MKQLLQAVGYYTVYGGIFIFSILPLSILYLFSDLAFFFVYHIAGYRRAVVVQNLSRAFPEKRYSEINRINKTFYRVFTGYFAEIAKMISASARQMEQRVRFKNAQIIDEYTGRGKNVIIALGHCGNWEMLSTAPLALKSDIYAVYKPLRNRIFNRLMIRIRSRFGMKPIPSDAVTRHILNRDSPAAAYLFLADQCPGRVTKENKYTFLNQESGMYKGIEKLAKKTDSAVVFFHITHRERGHYLIECIPICENGRTDKIDIIPVFIQLLEKNIREKPHGWLWSHKRWKR
ncbi:MAG: lysophospholipid acyltransferase family protein [Proteiniphilum sp.]|jgi:KDO2-lipid IV(A) lauroyltransferase|nr:lysophospholipid acyltransferase family protein [Proteiniphilum sp.]